MIKLVVEGHYKLIETKNHIKILHLDDDVYAWPETMPFGEMLIVSHRMHKTDAILSLGSYKLYRVQDEADLTDTTHLELEVGENTWQGYLLLTGLPTDQKLRSRIIPTHEVITRALVNV